MRVRKTIETGPLPLDRLVLALPALVRARSGLRFEDGTFVDDEGRRREGLRIVAGTHPAVGTRYGIVTREAVVSERDTATATGPAATSVEVVADDLEAIVVTVRDETTSDLVADVRLDHPAAPTRAEATLHLTVPSTGLAKGVFTGEATATVTDLAPGDRSTIHVEVRGRHRFYTLAGSVTIEPTTGGRLSMALALRAHGRGVFRPVVAVGSLMVRSSVRGELDRMARDLPRRIDVWAQRLADDLGPTPDPDDVARHLLDDLLDHVAVAVPAPR